MCCATKIGEEIYENCNEIIGAEKFEQLTTSEAPMTSTTVEDETEKNFVENFVVDDGEEMKIENFDFENPSNI